MKKCRKRTAEEDAELRDAFELLNPFNAIAQPGTPDPLDPCWYEQANVWKLEDEIAEAKAKLLILETQLDMWKSALEDCKGGMIV